ncbi:hypothetical protein [Alteromonas sp. KUL49]|uniref:hypothetical protein n=1 Tax=Alteromonas sp. KUL49 TaxID=2480798 RepID=UPI00102EF79C|nr:hypothetical protein [Alteromonas sp. KUL49]TAP39903.1 hypothetical protein EYS00_11440 [Alteromonas sp. KUL49]GEA11927.1 hypothetical protein KUL49_23020 [Alteromonas sp. KUL49]
MSSMKLSAVFSRVVMTVAFSLCVFGNAYASVQVLDFTTAANGDVISNGQIIDDEYSEWGVTVSSCSLNGSQMTEANHINGNCVGGTENVSVAFDTSLSGTLDPDLEFVFDNGVYRANEGSQDIYEPLQIAGAGAGPGSVLILHERPYECSNGVCANPDDEGTRPAGFFAFDFAEPTAIVSLDFFDIEYNEANTATKVSSLYFHLSDGSIVQSDVVDTGDGGYERVEYANMFDVVKLVVNMPGSGAINNLVFGQNPTVVTPVSAPAVLGMLMLSFSYLARRSRYRFSRK